MGTDISTARIIPTSLNILIIMKKVKRTKPYVNASVNLLI